MGVGMPLILNVHISILNDFIADVKLIFVKLFILLWQMLLPRMMWQILLP